MPCPLEVLGYYPATGRLPHMAARSVHWAAQGWLPVLVLSYTARTTPLSLPTLALVHINSCSSLRVVQ